MKCDSIKMVSKWQAYNLSRPGLFKRRAQNGFESLPSTILFVEKQIYSSTFLHIYTKATEEWRANSNITMIDLRTEEGDGRGHKAWSACIRHC